MAFNINNVLRTQRRCVVLAAVLAFLFSSPVTAQNAINTATVTAPSGVVDPDSANNTATDSDPIATSADVSVTKTDNATTYIPGTAVVYTIVVRNAGLSAAASVRVLDSPSDGTITTWTCTTGGGGGDTGTACPSLSGSATLDQTIPTLANGDSLTYQVTLQVPSGKVDALDNTVTATSPTPDPDTGNNTVTDTDTALPTADVSIVKSQASPNPATPGQAVSWTITAHNGGPSDAPMATTDAVPASVTGLSVGGTNGGACIIAGQNISCDFGTVPNGDDRVYTITGTLAASAMGTLSNTAIVSTTATGDTPGNNTSTSDTPIAAAADLSLTKTVDNTMPNVGSNVTFTVTLSNAGPSGVTGVSVVDQLPSGYTYVSSTPSQGTYAEANGTWSVGTLAANGSANLQIVATVLATGVYTNVTQVTASDQPDPDSTPGDDTGDDYATSTPAPIPLASFNFCAVNTVFNITGTGLGTASARAQTFLYTIGGVEQSLPALDKLLPNGSFNGNMVDPVRNRLMFYNRTGGSSELWAYDPGNGGWYQAATFSSGDIPRAGMNQVGTGYLIGSGASPPVYRVQSSSLYGYAVTAAGTLTYSTPPTDSGSGDIAFDAAGNGWMVVGQDVWKVDAATLAANAPVAVRQQRPTLGGSPLSFSLAGIAFGSDGRLYVANSGASGPASSYYALDLSTGTLTQVASATLARDLASCAFPAIDPAVLSAEKTLAQVNGAPYVAGAAVQAGDTLDYEIVVAYVSGNVAAALVPGDVVETLPANTTAVIAGNDFSCTGSNCPNTATRNIPVGGSTTLHFLVKVDAALPPNTLSITNAVTVKGVDCAAAGNDCSEISPVANATTEVVKTSDPATGVTVTPGQTITYTLTTTVSGSALTQDLTLADTISANQTFVGVTAAGAYTCNGALNCVLPAGTLPGTYAVSYTATVNANATGSVGNSVVASNPIGGDPDPTCTTCTTDHPVGRPSLSTLKTMNGYIDADGDGAISIGDTLNYTVTATNTGNVVLNNVTITDSMLTPSTVTCSLVPPNGTCVLTGTYVVTQADADAGLVVNTALVESQPLPGDPPLPPQACPPGSTDVRCGPSVTTQVIQRPSIATIKTATLSTDNGTQAVGNNGDVITYAVMVTNTGNVTLQNITVSDIFDGGPSTILTCAPTTLAPGAVATCNSYTHTITGEEANSGKPTLDNSVTASGQTIGGTQSVTITATSTASIAIEPDPTTVRITKTASPRDINIGALVRYTLVIQNTGFSAVVNGSLIDTPPAGFSYVENSLNVADADGAGRLVGTYPIRVDQVDIAAGDRATVTYLLRVGAGVRAGIHTNSAYVQYAGAIVSNVATADVQLVADPLLDESLVVGTVFDDRDGDGWQDSAAMSDMQVQGGFAPDAYVAGSTSVDRGNGPTPKADASAPLLHGIDLGALDARQSEADMAAAHRVVVSQTLRALDFNDGFVLTTKQGVSVHMDAAGNTRTEQVRDAAKGLNAAAPRVERRVSQVADGYRVDYLIENTGVDERGIPGVRIASVEGLLMETDQFGRYHLVGVQGGRWERGRNFILKLDPATLPPGSVLTTDNPLVRRITPGLPARFDFGVKLPPALIEGGTQTVEMELGTVLFDVGSSNLRDAYLSVIDKMADEVRKHGGGEVVIAASANDSSQRGDSSESNRIAYDRARRVQTALFAQLTPEQARGLNISLRVNTEDADSTVLSLGEQMLLGTVLFDTDSEKIKPEFNSLIDSIAAHIDALGGGTVGIVGHADKRGSDSYNAVLGMRRAKAVFQALAAKLKPAVRDKLRVQISDDPISPANALPSGGSKPEGRP